MSSLLQPFLGALQASLSVLIVIAIGGLASYLGFLSQSASTEVSKLTVKFLLPCLLVVNIGSEVSLGSIGNYLPVFVWSLIYNIISLLYGHTIVKALKFPGWVTAAICFNNTTSLPLLLIESLASAKILDSVLAGEGDSTSDAVNRAKSYFLLNSIVGNTLTFAVGPRLLKANSEDVPNGNSGTEKKGGDGGDEERDGEGEGDEEERGEDSPLLGQRAEERESGFKKRMKRVVEAIAPFLNESTYAAVIGLVLGLAPPLHKAFFNGPMEGGVMNAWFTNGVKQVGNLFAALQTMTVGVKLAAAFKLQGGSGGEASERDESEQAQDERPSDEQGQHEHGKWFPWREALLIETTRHILWPAASIPLIYIATLKLPGLIPPDPILWFSLMMAPTGPPALKLTALADVNGSSEGEKRSIARFLCLSYIVSPIMALAVVGSLQAVQAAVEQRPVEMRPSGW